MATSPITETIMNGNRLCDLHGDRVVYNRAAIMRRAWHYVDADAKAVEWALKRTGKEWERATFAECLRRAWDDARFFANDLYTLKHYRNASAAERRVATLEANNRLGPLGWNELDEAKRDLAAA